MSHRPIVMFALALLGVATPTTAQMSTTRGWSLAVQAQAASLTVEDGDANTGGGGGIRAGYAINRRFTVFLAIDGASVDVVDARDEVLGQWTLAHVDLGVRFYFANALNRWVPFLEAALGGRRVGLEDGVIDEVPRTDVSLSGAAFTLGGGLDFYLNQTLALGGELKFSSGDFTDIEVGEILVGGFDIKAESVRFGLALTWWP